MISIIISLLIATTVLVVPVLSINEAEVQPTIPSRLDVKIAKEYEASKLKDMKPAEPKEIPQTKVKPEILGTRETYLANVLARINNSRSSRGIHKLGRRAVLDRTASAKCKDMVKKGYWGHNPPGSTFVAHMQANGFKGTAYGENLARGYYGNASKQHSDWMGSTTHRANILHRSFTIFGVSTCNYSSGKDLTVVHFGRP